MKTVAIVQSNYLPWKGYFHLIHLADVFVFLDSVQYTSRDWRNRNRIITPQGFKWLTVPVHSRRGMNINHVSIDNSRSWAARHYKLLCNSYGKAACFDEYRPFLEDVYLKRTWQNLSELNQTLIKAIAEKLGITTEFYTDNNFMFTSEKNQRLIDIVLALQGDCYLTGPKALHYLDIRMFEKLGVKVKVMEYPVYPYYEQLWKVCCSEVSILDLLFHKGKESPKFIWGKT